MPARDSCEDIKRWRRRAREVRALADTLGEAPSVKTLLEVADAYDKLADDLEASLKRMGYVDPDKAT